METTRTTGCDFRFERLDFWRRAVALAPRIYRATRTFPDDERFGLTSQLRRAVVSISANIAEGSGRASPRDQAHFLDLAYGSAMEVVSEAEVAHALGYLAQSLHSELRAEIFEIAAMLTGLKRSILAKATP